MLAAYSSWSFENTMLALGVGALYIHLRMILRR